MMITDAHWDLGLKAIAALATTIVAGYVARISRQQWLTNREKLRLDLYDRRFKIYVRVLEFYNAVILWDGSDEQQGLKAPYTQAFRESRFLFPKNSGIFSFLDEFSKKSVLHCQFRPVEGDEVGRPARIRKAGSKEDR